MRIICLAERYPYYLAEHRVGRLEGQAPLSIRFIPSLKRKWDQGGFGTGTRLTEVRADTPSDLLAKLRGMRLNPAFDDVEIYFVRAPNSPRERIPTGRFMNDARRDEGRSPTGSSEGSTSV